MNLDSVTHAVASAFKDSRTRRILWLAAALLAVVVAIPLLLSRPGRATAVAALPAAPSTTVAMTPSLSAGASASAHRRTQAPQSAVTGPAHNPFADSAHSARATSTASGTAKSSASRTSSGASAHATSTAGHRTSATATRATQSRRATSPAHHSASHASATHPRTSRPVAHTTTATTRTVTTATSAPASRYVAYQARISLLQSGAGTSPTVFHNVARDALLPTDSAPFGAFLGIQHQRDAVFLLAEDTRVSGSSGRCAPSAAHCGYLVLTPGQAVTITVTPANGAPSVWKLRDDTITRVTSSASTVSVDAQGAQEIRNVAGVSRTLSTLSYGRLDGLLDIDLGSTQAVAR